MIGIDHWRSAGFALEPSDLRALSQAELQQRHIANLAGMQNASHGVAAFDTALGAWLFIAAPVSVPQGWADWYSIGDQLH